MVLFKSRKTGACCGVVDLDVDLFLNIDGIKGFFDVDVDVDGAEGVLTFVSL